MTASVCGGRAEHFTRCADRRVLADGRGWSARRIMLAIVLIAGCEAEAERAPEPPKLVPVQGTVTVDGKPLAGAVVVFLPAFSDAGTHSVGETDRDGVYKLATLYQPGAGVGDYRVIVSHVVDADGTVASLAARSGEYVPPEVNHGQELVPPRYSDVSKTELRASVRPGTGSINLDLIGPLLPAPGKAGSPESS